MAAERIVIVGAGPALPTPDPHLEAVVVVPARDEAERIGACLLALAEQRGVSEEAYEVVVVLDGCRDTTRERALDVVVSYPQLRLHLVELSAPSGVGRARRVGMDLACERLLAVDRAQGLIASTDADSVVAWDWLAAQRVLAATGASAIGGLIELDPVEAGELSREALQRRGAEAVRRLRARAAEGYTLERSDRRAPPIQRRLAGAHRRGLPAMRRAAGVGGPRG